MSKFIVFVQDTNGLAEAEMPEAVTGQQLAIEVSKLGALTDDSLVFIDEADDPVDLKSDAPVRDIKRGSRVHVTRCRRIKVTVHFLEKTAEETFSPGHRVRRVKAWAVDQFGLKNHDAAEHVLQLCGSTDRPATDTPLRELTVDGQCSVCFDLVPEKRVEG